MRILVTGSTGYIGGRLVSRLLDAGHEVRVLVRSLPKLQSKPWHSRVTAVVGDAGNPDDVRKASAGCEVAYYLLHSLSTDPAFVLEEAQVATTFAYNIPDVSRVIYLGGLIPKEDKLSAHMASRQAVGEILRRAPTPCVELRASVIIGSGSASFEMLRYLAERLPVMTTPRWVRTRTQPIATRDVLRYLVAALDLPADLNRTFDIGGPEVLTYQDMLSRFTAVRGLPPRFVIPVPVLTPGLSSRWVSLVTPVPASIARPLVDSLKNEATCSEDEIHDYLPRWDLIGFEEAVTRALSRIKEANVSTRWSDSSLPNSAAVPWPGDPEWSGGSLRTDTRDLLIDATPRQVWEVIESIGGENGWYSWNLGWRARGWLDTAVGGVGLRRGRRDPKRLSPGDALDFWRVEERTPPFVLRLRAEMKLPGYAWLEWKLTPTVDGRTVVTQRALYHPFGLTGEAYWFAVAPFHLFVFKPMLAALGREAKRRAQRTLPALP